jgi:hypothetical protein
MSVPFVYVSGEIVKVGDRLCVWSDRMATVSKIFAPFSETAVAWQQPQGGVLLTFDDGDCWLNTSFDEDYELVSRAAEDAHHENNDSLYYYRDGREMCYGE